MHDHGKLYCGWRLKSVPNAQTDRRDQRTAGSQIIGAGRKRPGRSHPVLPSPGVEPPAAGAAKSREKSRCASGTERKTSSADKTGKTKDSDEHGIFIRRGDKGQVEVDNGQQDLRPAFTVGSLPPPKDTFDRVITLGRLLPFVDWATGDLTKAGTLLRVQTRPSILYARLFEALGDFATGVEYLLLFVAIVFAMIELLALFVGARLTRSITGAVAQLYQATGHVNRGDFGHRISVKSHDQLATLANSFNSMTTSIEDLIEEQKEKQRLENELTIAQEVQAQLFPQHISQLASLEVYGFCRPARTVSGDYYDFLTVESEKVIFAVGDVSGKGISAALLMATIHSAVRAYSLEGNPSLRLPVAVGETTVVSGARPRFDGAEVSPAPCCARLNHQLFQSTPAEKYATLFLGVYDGHQRKLTYSNGGHLPPIILGEEAPRDDWRVEERSSAYSITGPMRRFRGAAAWRTFCGLQRRRHPAGKRFRRIRRAEAHRPGLGES